MFTLLTVLLGVIFIKLLLVAAMNPSSSELSRFELERRAEDGDKHAQAMLRREELLPDVFSLQRVLLAILLVVFVALSVATFQWLFGIIIAVVVALEYGALSRLPFIRSPAKKLYSKYESDILRIVEQLAPVFRIIRGISPEQPVLQLHSKQELGYLIEESVGVLSPDEKKLIIGGLGADKRLVREVMTPRSVIDSIAKKEHLGPLVLDDLHKTGHSRFPVIDGDVDHVVGMLHIHDLLVIEAGRRSTSVEKAMEPRVFYIREDQTLKAALAAFLRTHHHLFVVVNEFRETVGLLSLEDIIEAILGRKIVDEFDTHEDLRIVAERNPRENNDSSASINV